MRIVHPLLSFIAVLSLAAVFGPVYSYEHFNHTLSVSRSKRSPNKHHRHHQMHEFWYDPFYQHEIPLPNAGKLLSPRENQELLRNETQHRTAVDCCPSVLEMVEPEGGKNQDDQYVELYRDGENRQRFYELSCHKDIEGKPCRFMDKKLHIQSKCVQKYSYTYALVKDPGRHHHQRPNYFPAFPSTGGATFTLDYIRVRSGCSCVVSPNAKKKRDRKLKRRGGKDDSDQ
ncbi:hypothetical protein RN001_004949 [Aquatica leii]|uniref:Spaetzle domain-containing protein n=1 Tax=Aquatica leii TaxID=1421715 RepID=A0AAN7Q690_9COLE|nr:hypothetical protein RN001_004949 [Aquatica leii]